jgi:FtsH-binding integral membrane protein
MDGSVMIAASIFLDVFNVFLFMLQIFGGGGRR